MSRLPTFRDVGRVVELPQLRATIVGTATAKQNDWVTRVLGADLSAGGHHERVAVRASVNDAALAAPGERAILTALWDVAERQGSPRNAALLKRLQDHVGQIEAAENSGRRVEAPDGKARRDFASRIIKCIDQAKSQSSKEVALWEPVLDGVIVAPRQLLAAIDARIYEMLETLQNDAIAVSIGEDAGALREVVSAWRARLPTDPHLAELRKSGRAFEREIDVEGHIATALDAMAALAGEEA